MKQFTIRSMLFHMGVIAFSTAMIRYGFLRLAVVVFLTALISPLTGESTGDSDQPVLHQTIMVFIVLYVFVSTTIPACG